MEVTNPWSVLPIKNTKYAKSCTELHLSDRGIKKLENFEAFTNVQVLWLNNNKIRKLENLNQNFRIKQLYLENNYLNSLEGSLKCLKFIEILLLGKNHLRNLDKILEVLSKLTCLERLSNL